MSAGSHHFFLFNMTSAEAAVEPPVGTLGDCAGKGLEFHPFPFLSQQPDWTVSYPTGVGRDRRWATRWSARTS